VHDSSGSAFEGLPVSFSYRSSLSKGLSVIRLILAILLWALGTTVNYELFAIIVVWVIYVFGFLGSVHRRTGYLLVVSFHS
jgi:hypothetical protein